MNLKNRYTFGDMVYITTDIEQKKRIITSIVVKPNGLVYEVSCGDEEPSYHYEFELSDSEDTLMKIEKN